MSGLFSDYYDDDETENSPVEAPSTDPEYVEPGHSEEEERSQSVQSEEKPRAPEQSRRAPTHDRKDSSGLYDLPDEEDDHSPRPSPATAPNVDPNKRDTACTDRIVLSLVCLVVAAMAGTLIYYGVKQESNEGNKGITTRL